MLTNEDFWDVDDNLLPYDKRYARVREEACRVLSATHDVWPTRALSLEISGANKRVVEQAAPLLIRIANYDLMPGWVTRMPPEKVKSYGKEKTIRRCVWHKGLEAVAVADLPVLRGPAGPKGDIWAMLQTSEPWP
jgi:hypothetical protein